jgi:hypothetical protein
MMAEETEIQSLAPPGLPPQQRQHFDRILNKLIEREACSVCDKTYPNNSRLAYGLDHVGEIVVVGECCIDEMTIVLGHGFFIAWSRVHHVEPSPPTTSARNPPTRSGRRSRAWEQIDEAIALRQKAIAASRDVAGKQPENIQRYGGVRIIGKVLLELDSLWRIDDRTWFEKNPTRSRRARMPFDGEDFLFVTEALPGCSSLVLVRQIKPGARQRLGFDLTTALLPLPDDEALIHAMFEIASKREPAPTTMPALNALREKYAVPAFDGRGSRLSS